VDRLTGQTLPGKFPPGKAFQKVHQIGLVHGAFSAFISVHMRTSNPTLRSETFTSEALTSTAAPMTIQGTTQKCGILLAITIATATLGWKLAPALGMPLIAGGAIAGLIIAVILCFKPTLAPVLAPIYAIVKGLFVGAISAMYNQVYDGLVVQAVMLTFGTFVGMLAAYQTGLIRPSENFKLGIIAATGGIMIVYLASWLLGMFGISMPFIHDSGPIGIGFSLFVVVIAAMNLVLDFGFIEEGAASGAPKYMEWYGAFGLLVTLIWLYIEILRLLSKLRSR
jgi:uncharacterized YccA/Bax inhibitor family protein